MRGLVRSKDGAKLGVKAASPLPTEDQPRFAPVEFRTEMKNVLPSEIRHRVPFSPIGPCRHVFRHSKASIDEGLATAVTLVLAVSYLLFILFCPLPA
jgi:hypothetical protein